MLKFSSGNVAPMLMAVSLFLMLALTAELSAQPANEQQTAALTQELKSLHSAIEAVSEQQRAEGTTSRGAKSIVRFEDITICEKAGQWILRHKEFYKPAYVADTQKVLALGTERLAQWQAGKADWGTTPGSHALAYRSRVDDSLQPYAVSLPKDFEANSAKRWPLYVVLHGRNGTLNEVSFIKSHSGKAPDDEQEWIQLDVFGRCKTRPSSRAKLAATNTAILL